MLVKIPTVTIIATVIATSTYNNVAWVMDSTWRSIYDSAYVCKYTSAYEIQPWGSMFATD